MIKLQEKMNLAAIKAKLKMKEILSEQRGDTNFISIAIVLAIVVIVAGVFIGFKDQLIGKAEGEVTNFVGSTW